MRFPLEFGQPWALWLLVALVPVGYLAWTTRAPLRTGRWWFSTLTRVVLVLLVVLSLADTRWSRRADELCVFFLVDGSKSTGPRALERAERRIATEVEQMRKDDRFGVIVFGQRPRLVRSMGPKGKVRLASLDPRVADFTNIGRAIRYAASQFPDDCQKRIVLLSDGNENLGNAAKEAQDAAANDIDIIASPLAIRHEAEVLVDSLLVPPRARPHQPIELRACIRSSTETDVAVKVFRDHEQIAEGTVHLTPGPKVIHLATDAVTDSGFHNYEVLVEAPPGTDTSTVNNTGLAYTQVYGEARVLYLEGFPEHAVRLTQALRSSARRPKGGFSLETGSMMNVPQTIEEMARYDCIILSDIPASTMSASQMEAMKYYVEQVGGGLVMIGGEKSLTTGGYVKTPIEEALPVSLQLDREKHLASLALAIVVDQSGSMGMTAAGGGASKMDLANQACANAVKLLSDYDEAGVCMTDTSPKWVGGKLRAMTPGNKSRLIRDVLSQRPGGGGIMVKTGIHAAYAALHKSTAQTRHIILFADAQDSEQQNGCYAMARQELARNKITLTAVGLGARGDPHVGFLRTLSERHGNGRFYLTNRASDLPEIFVKDTYIVSRNAIVEIPEGFSPGRTSNAEVIRGIDWPRAPKLYGYVATMPDKPKSEILLTAKDDEPLLARWRYGLGKSTVFTSDAKDRWARDWAAWGDFDRFWSQIVRWTMRETKRGDVSTQVVLDGNRGRILVDAIDSDGEYINGKMLSVRIITADPDVKPETLALHQVGPGRYSGAFDLKATGVAYQVVVVDEEHRGSIVDSVGAVLSYAPEYRDMEPDTALLDHVAEASRGRYMASLSGTFQRERRPVSALRSIWVALLMVTVGLLVVDIAARRLVLPDWLLKQRGQAGRKLAQGADTAMARLRESRELLRRKQTEFDRLPETPDRDRGPLGDTLLKARGTGQAPQAPEPGDDGVVPLRRAGSTEGGAPPNEPSTTEQLLKAKQRMRHRRRPDNDSQDS